MSFKFLDLTTEIPESQMFKKMIIFSLFLHLTLVFVFGVKAYIFPSEALNLDTAIKVDMVDLPDKIQNLPAPPPPQAEVTTKPIEAAKPQEASPPKPEAVVLKPKKTKEKALDKIKKLAKEEQKRNRLAEIEKEVKQQEAQERALRQSQARNSLIKGNVISPGSSLHGLAKADFNEYLGNIYSHVEPQWNLPEWLRNDNLKAVVTVYIDNNGTVIKRFLKKSSGDQRFDNYALKAIDDSSPFPKPPPKFVDLVRVDGIEVGFPE
ncbi:MAG: TonB family protein [Oligoflexia bacterium]|nr:TonB family protein [Oligoflexia bacterium]